MCAAGELSIRVIDSLLGVLPKLWEFSGKTGTEENTWQHAELTIGVRNRFQVRFFYPRDSRFKSFIVNSMYMKSRLVLTSWCLKLAPRSFVPAPKSK